VPDELRAMQNVVLLPHIGSASVVTRNAMDQLVVDNLQDWFCGKPPLDAGTGNPGEGSLMMGRFGLRLRRCWQSIACGSPARSQDASNLEKRYGRSSGSFRPPNAARPALSR